MPVRLKSTVAIVLIALSAVLMIVWVYGMLRDYQHRALEDPPDQAAPRRDHQNAPDDQSEHSGFQSKVIIIRINEDAQSTEQGDINENGERVIVIRARRFEFEPDRIVVNQGDRVRLEITSEDVPHGFALPAFGIDRRVEPGQTEVITFVADKPGRHRFHCSVYCGIGHITMRGELVVFPSGEDKEE